MAAVNGEDFVWAFFIPGTVMILAGMGVGWWIQTQSGQQAYNEMASEFQQRTGTRVTAVYQNGDQTNSLCSGEYTVTASGGKVYLIYINKKGDITGLEPAAK
jgi:hypothetical protein